MAEMWYKQLYIQQYKKSLVLLPIHSYHTIQQPKQQSDHSGMPFVASKLAVGAVAAVDPF